MQHVNTLDGERSSGDRVVRTAWYDKIGPAEVINRTVWRHGAVFGRVTPRRAHRTGETVRTTVKNQSRQPPSRSIPFKIRTSSRHRRRLGVDMLRKLLSKSGRRLLRAIKKLSTRSRKVKKSRNLTSWHSNVAEFETESLSWSLPSLDAKSIDTFTTYVADNSDDGVSMCCYCDEYEENQRNENIENEMMI